MVNVALSAGRLLVALFLVGLNGFFVAAEFAFVRVAGPPSSNSSRKAVPARTPSEG